MPESGYADPEEFDNFDEKDSTEVQPEIDQEPDNWSAPELAAIDEEVGD